jgi:hypothetical protein
MMKKRLGNPDLEPINDRLAETIDDVPEEKRLLFLAKLALVLANLVGDRLAVENAIEASRHDL